MFLFYTILLLTAPTMLGRDVHATDVIVCSHQTLEVLDEEHLLINGATEDKTLVEQVVATFESIFPRNAMEVSEQPS